MIAGLLVMSGTWTACVGDDPGAPTTGARATGDRLGPCFPDGKCKEGLVCRDGEICLAPDEPKPSGLDGGPQTPDGGGEDARPPIDGSVDAGGLCAVPNATPGPRCGASSCGAAQACCAGGGNEPACVALADPSCQQSAARWGCDSDDQCGSNACCFLGTNSVSVRCTSAMTAATSSCMPPNECVNNGGMRGCRVPTDCPNGTTCGPTEMTTKLGFTVIVNACR